MHIPVYCYGLRADFYTNIFPASQRLSVLADCMEEVNPVTCRHCESNNAKLNLRFVNGAVDITGPYVQLGAEESSVSVLLATTSKSLQA